MDPRYRLSVRYLLCRSRSVCARCELGEQATKKNKKTYIHTWYLVSKFTGNATAVSDQVRVPAGMHQVYCCASECLQPVVPEGGMQHVRSHVRNYRFVIQVRVINNTRRRLPQSTVPLLLKGGGGGDEPSRLRSEKSINIRRVPRA